MHHVECIADAPDNTNAPDTAKQNSDDLFYIECKQIILNIFVLDMTY